MSHTTRTMTAAHTSTPVMRINAAPAAQSYVVGYSTQTPSYVPPVAQTPSYVPPVAPPAVFPAMPPQSSLASMPDPVSIAKQKDGYAQMLDNQLKEGAAALDKQLQYQKDFLHTQAEAQKKQYIMQVDQQVKSQENSLHQQHNEQMLNLKQQAAQQKAALEQQAMQLTLEYQKKVSQEEMQKKLFEMQKGQYEAGLKMNEQVKQLQSMAMTPWSAVPEAALDEKRPPEVPAAPTHAASVMAAPTQTSYVPAPAVAVPYAPPATTITSQPKGHMCHHQQHILWCLLKARVCQRQRNFPKGRMFHHQQQHIMDYLFKSARIHRQRLRCLHSPRTQVCQRPLLVEKVEI